MKVNLISPKGYTITNYNSKGPGIAVHQMQSQPNGEIPLNEISNFTLKDIDDGIAYIESKGQMISDKSNANENS